MEHWLLWLMGNSNDLAKVECYQWYVHGVIKKDLVFFVLFFLENKTHTQKKKSYSKSSINWFSSN